MRNSMDSPFKEELIGIKVITSRALIEIIFSKIAFAVK